MKIQRVIPIVLEHDPDLASTIDLYLEAENAASRICYQAGGRPLSKYDLHVAAYKTIRESGLSAQLSCSVIRAVAAAYSAHMKRLSKAHKAKGLPAPTSAARVIEFTSAHAVFLVGSRGRDAVFRPDGRLEVSTSSGRRTIGYRIPGSAEARFRSAASVDSLTVLSDRGRLVGKLCVTLDAPEPSGTRVVGVDLNESNLVVAVDADGRELVYDGRPLKARNKRTGQVRKRLQRKMWDLKAQGKDTHGVRRALKRLGSKQSNRTTNECRLAARVLTDWAGPDSRFALEDLSLKPVTRKTSRSRTTRRRLGRFPYRQLREAITFRCEALGMGVELVNAYLTSQTCNACGKVGERHRHKFSCPHCGNEDHADINAAKNIRDRHVGPRPDGLPPMSPEARLIGQAA